MRNLLAAWLDAVRQLLPHLRDPRARPDAARAILRITGVVARRTLRAIWLAALWTGRTTPTGFLAWLLLRRHARRAR